MSFTGNAITCIRSDRVVFQRLSFSVKDGEILYLKGPNGCGKSSLLRIMAGLLQPTEGVLYWNEENISKSADSFLGNFQYIGHQNAVKGALSVKENLKIWAEIYNLKKNNISIGDALQALKLDSLANLPARFLSAGQKRRLNLSRLSATYSRLWLLDEPSTSLDDTGSLCLKELINSHLERGNMVIMANHESNLVNGYTLNLAEFEFNE